MKFIRISFLLVLMSISLFAQTEKDYTKRAEQIYQWLRDEQYGKVTAEFDSSLGARVDVEKLSNAWTNLRKNVGNFEKVVDTTIEHRENFEVVIQHSQFEKKMVDFKLVFGSNDKVKGIFLTPVAKKFQFDFPQYYDSTLITESRMNVITGNFRLPAFLTKPKNAVRPPVVILVHGSGPNDRDETVGNTKIFRDLAVGLAAQGVAVLRYDKRTRNYRALMQKNKAKLTVKEETMDDVLSAIRELKNDTTIDNSKIYLLGHSLGAMLLPRIASQTTDLKGLIMLAANARPMEDLMLEQMEYLTSQEAPSVELTQTLDSMKREVKRIKALSPANANDSIGILGIPVSYWLDLKTYDPVKTAAKLNLPIFVLSGGRDYQVPSTDFELWKSGLKNSRNATFRLYPSANHLFIAGEGKSLPAEYDQPGHVDKAVVDDIASFILTGKPK